MIFSLVVAAALLCYSCGSGNSFTPSVENGNFINGLDGWTTESSGGAEFDSVYDAGSNFNFLRIRHATESRSSAKTTLNVEKERYYTISFRYKITGASVSLLNAGFKALIVEDENAELGNSVISYNREDWTDYEFSFNSGQYNTLTFKVVLGINGVNSATASVAGVNIRQRTENELLEKGVAKIGFRPQNLVSNHNFFHTEEGSSIPISWDIVSDNSSKAAVMSQYIEASDLSYLRIDHLDKNVTALKQRISVRPKTYYRISFQISVPSALEFDEDVDPKIGFYASLDEKPDDILKNPSDKFNFKNKTSGSIYTFTQIKDADSFYVYTDLKTSVTLSLVLGHSVSPAKGSVYITNINFMEVGVTSVPFSNGYVSVFAAEANFASDIILTLVLSLAIIAVIIFGVWLLTRAMAAPKEKNEIVRGYSISALLSVMFILGGILRVVFAVLMKGQREEYNMLLRAAEYFSEYTFKGYYSTYITGDFLYPVMYYINALFGSIAQLFTEDSYFVQLFIKLPFMLADIGTAMVIYHAAQKYINQKTGLVAAAMYFLNPLFIFNSAISGQINSIAIFVIVASLYYLTQRKFAIGLGLYALALLVDKTAQFLLPVYLVMMGVTIYKAIRQLKDFKPDSKAGYLSSLVKDPKVGYIATIPIAIICYILLMYIVSLPMIISDFDSNFFTFIDKFFLVGLYGEKTYGANALGIFNIFLRNGKSPGVEFPHLAFSLIFLALSIFICLVIYMSKRNRANITLIAAYLLVTLATFFIGFNAYSLIPAVAILMLSFVLIRDKRILHIYALLSLIVFINGFSALAAGGYLGNAANHELNIGNLMYLGSSLLNEGGALAINVICSILAMLTHIYMTLIVLDITMTLNRTTLEPSADISIGQSIIKCVKINK